MRGPAAEAALSEEGWVDSPQLHWDERVMGLLLGAAIALFVAEFVVLIELGFLVLTSGLEALLVSGAVALALAVPLAVGAPHVSRLRMTDSGLELRTWFLRQRVSWGNLRPGLRYSRRRSFSIRPLLPNGRRDMTYRLSHEQAIALLSDPRTPRPLFPREAWESVGLSIPGSPS